jgi:propanol-preferring alcohol dehydrogenase
VRSLAIKGRALLVGITDQKFEIAPYGEILNKEAEIIGVSDHLAQEIPRLMEWVTRGRLNLSGAITKTIPLSAKAINDTLDRLEQFGDAVRVVITP